MYIYMYTFMSTMFKVVERKKERVNGCNPYKNEMHRMTYDCSWGTWVIKHAVIDLMIHDVLYQSYYIRDENQIKWKIKSDIINWKRIKNFHILYMYIGRK